MGAVLDGLVVVEVASSPVSSMVAMLLGDYGARVVKVDRPGADAPAGPGPLVWDRNKERIELDLASVGGRSSLAELVRGADVVVESFAPGAAAALGVDHDAFRAADPRLVTCSITPYGRVGAWADRPGWDALVQARSGIAFEQAAWDRPSGPSLVHAQLPTYGAFYLASCGINTALRSRERSGLGQHVETTLMDGAILWTTMLWTRAERPTPDLTTVFKFKDLMPTPTYETADGWIHAMPNAVPVGMAQFGHVDPEIDPMASMGDHGQRRRHQVAVERLFRAHTSQEWLDLLWASEVPAQPCLPPGECHTHPQVVHNRAVADVEVPGHGTLRQLGHAYHLELDDERAPVAARPLTAAVPAKGATPAPTGDHPSAPLAGIRVLDFGVALAGPFAPMVMADLGAEVIKVDTISPQVGSAGGFLWAACQRGKRSITLDLKSPEGREICRRLIATADVLHYNMRVGVAERLGISYDEARAIKPDIVHCHLTGYGNTGPLAPWPGVDQMGQALAGLEWEQGGGANGGNPQWSRFGMCDAAAGLLSVIGVLQALYHRERTGEGQQVETNILNAGLVFASDVVTGGHDVPERGHLDRDQAGIGPRYRFWETADGWLAVVAPDEGTWGLLLATLGRPELADAADDQALVELGAAFRSKSAADWFAALDAAGVPCEVVVESPADDASSGGSSPGWFADADARGAGWVIANDHPVWGRLEQPAGTVRLSGSPAPSPGRPPMVGGDTKDVLLELGYGPEEIDDLRAKGAVAW